MLRSDLLYYFKYFGKLPKCHIVNFIENMDLADKIWRRAGHLAFVHKGQSYFWGGYIEYLSKVIII